MPYIYYKNKNFKNVYGFIISRNFLEQITKIKNIDDDIRSPIYEALDFGYTEFYDFNQYCKEKILATLNKHKQLKSILLDLLNSIKQEKIVVIESGYAGTMPMMLKSLDERINFKLYTTAPFLYCHKYENIRNFETVISQNILMRYSSYSNGKFFVNISQNQKIKARALEEIKFFTK